MAVFIQLGGHGFGKVLNKKNTVPLICNKRNESYYIAFKI